MLAQFKQTEGLMFVDGTIRNITKTNETKYKMEKRKLNISFKVNILMIPLNLIVYATTNAW